MKKSYIIVGIVILGVILLAMFVSPKEKGVNLLNINYDVEGNEAKLNYDTENPVVAMYIKGYGSIVMELYPNVAPNTVSNFISLVKSGFYDNNTFHRLMTGFVLQGGDPTGTGGGDPGYSIEGEFSENGFDNALKHSKWTLSMARANDYNTAGSQFFICLEDRPDLDGKYATFGKVIDGYDNINDIVKYAIVDNEQTGKLRTNLVLEKALIDLKGKEYPDVIKYES